MNPKKPAIKAMPRPARTPFVACRKPLPRRQFLRGAGVALALPWLESMLPGLGRSAMAGSSPSAAATALTPAGTPRRMLGICNNLGLLADQFFPATAGRDYGMTPYLRELAHLRDDFTVFSGVSHPNVDGGHPADVCFLTAAPHPGSGSFRNTISLDQYVAEHIGTLTRYPSLTLAVNTGVRSLSWTGTGVAIPPEEQAARVFAHLFLQGSEREVEAQVRKLDTGASILDTIAGQAHDLQRNASAGDRERMDQYFTSVRDLEQRVKASRGWELEPKPVIDAPMPVDPTSPAAYMDKVKVMYDLVRLAFETDSTRAISLMLDGVSTPALDLEDADITDSYHNLSHHGMSEKKRAELMIIDTWHMKLLAGLLEDLKSVREGEATLLDRTMVLYGTNFGCASAHTCFNMPTIFAGGGFRHGQHLAFDTERNYPLPNLFVSMLQRLGIESDRFASSTGTMRGLDMA